MKSLIRCVATVAILSIAANPLVAHHSAAIFDLSRDIRIEGEVVRMRWANPHVYIQVRQKNADDTDIVWSIEGQTPSGMSREGWTPSTLVPGEKVIVAANPARDANRNIALGHTVLKDDGTTLIIPQASRKVENSNPIPDTTHIADSIAGHWVTRWNQEVAMGFLRARSLLKLTEAGEAAMDSYDNSLNPGNVCVPEPIPYVVIWPNGKSIELGADEILIRDELGPERRIDLYAQEHADNAEPSVAGHSIGGWVDGVLVVDTTNFSPNRRGLAVGGLASGPNKHLVEKFALSEDRTKLVYQFVLEDSDYLAEPVSGLLELDYRPDLPFVNEPCDLENAQIYLEN